MSVKLLPHNEIAYKNVRRILQEKNRVAVINTRGTEESSIALKLIEDNPDKKIIYVSFRNSSLYKLKNDMLKNGVNFDNLEMYTYNRLVNIQKSNGDAEKADIIILEKFEYCVSDNYKKSIENLFNENSSAKILGISSSPVRFVKRKIEDLTKDLFFNNIASRITLEEAIMEGILPKPNYVTSIYDYQKIIKSLKLKVQKCNNSEKRSKAEEKLNELENMLNLYVKQIPELLKSNMPKKNGKYVVFLGEKNKDINYEIEETKKIFEEINHNLDIISISGNSNFEKRRILESFKSDVSTDKLKLLFLVDVVKNEYDLSDVDGVIIKNFDKSINIYEQQLSIALSIVNKKNPIIIYLFDDLVSLKNIEEFYRRLNGAKIIVNNTDDFSVSNQLIKISEKIDEINKITYRNGILSYKERLELMLEYKRETGKDIEIDTVYKGYNIGYMQHNIRQKNYDGKLNIDDELLEKYYDAGIILRKRIRRNKTSQEEKYEFLISFIGKSPEEISKARMKNGSTYSDIKYQMQREYSKGLLTLPQEQIDYLIKNGILNYSIIERKKIISDSKVLQNYIVDIVKKYGSYDNFLQKYKRCEIDYDFDRKTFCGYRGVVLSEEDITERKKASYSHLVRDMIKDRVNIDYNTGSYIDIDGLKKSFSVLKDRERQILEMYYGIDTKNLTLKEIACKFDLTKQRIIQIRERALEKLEEYNEDQPFLANINDSKKVKNNIYSLIVVMSCIVDDDGNLKSLKDIEDVQLINKYAKGNVKNSYHFLYICNLNLEKYIKKLQILELNSLRYNIAKENYLKLEDIFIQDFIVPKVPKQIDKEDINVDVLKSENPEDKQEIINSIIECQSILSELLKKMEEKKERKNKS